MLNFFKVISLKLNKWKYIHFIRALVFKNHKKAQTSQMSFLLNVSEICYIHKFIKIKKILLL